VALSVLRNSALPVRKYGALYCPDFPPEISGDKLTCLFKDTMLFLISILNYSILKLHLLRHAKTEAIYSGISDIERRLLPKGKEQCLLLNSYFLNIDFSNTLFYSSSAQRTLETISIVFENTYPFQIIDKLYLASARQMLLFVNELKSEKDIFIVGHNDGLTDLVNYLCINANVLMRTAEYIQIDFDVNNTEYISNGLGLIKKSFHPLV
jgi:phosphohistidine phosphatase